MKLNQFVLIFVIITVSVIIYTDIKTNNLKAVIDNKEQIDRNLDAAIDDGVSRLAEVDESNHITIDKEAAVNSFFISLQSSFGILSDKENREKLNLYIPVVAVTEEDGYYVFFSDEYTGSDGYAYAAKRWSEKYPYYYEDSDFIYSFTLGDVVSVYDKNNLLGDGTDQTIYSMDYHDYKTDEDFISFRSLRPDSILLHDEVFNLIRKETIISCLENTMAYYTSRHNQIASHYGITYNFALPEIKNGEWAGQVDDISMYVVFQGYPYGNQIGETYNRVATAAAEVSKRKVYYIEQKGWYLIYHKSTCPELLKEGIIQKDELYYDSLDCVKQGCYQCPVCFSDGVQAPEYNP